MHLNAVILGALSLFAAASSLEKRATCSAYTLINTRGTGEQQGESSAFKTMNSNILKQVSGGTKYNTVYPAGYNQDSSAATKDIVNQVQSGLSKNSAMCFIIEGYSQGAAATVNALSQLTGANFNAVRGVWLVGDPNHKAGLACNKDPNNGTSTLNARGVSSSSSNAIPSNWVAKTYDVCKSGDGICDSANGSGANQAHLSYPSDSATQNLGTSFFVGKLRG